MGLRLSSSYLLLATIVTAGMLLQGCHRASVATASGDETVSDASSVAEFKRLSKTKHEEKPGPSMRGIWIEEERLSGTERASRPGYIRRHFELELRNKSYNEVSEVAVRLVVRLGSNSEPVFTSEPLPLTQFRNKGFPHIGNLLLGLVTDPIKGIYFDYPSNLWRADTQEDVQICSVTRVPPNADLHDLGHLFCKFAMTSDPDMLKILQADPSIIKDRNSLGMTATLAAAGTADVRTLAYLATHGGSWKDQSPSGVSMMHVACLLNRDSVRDLVLAHGGNVNARSVNGITPLMYSMICENLTAVKWLVKHHANVNQLSNDGASPAAVAVREGLPAALDTLVKAGADIHWHNGGGIGLMHLAFIAPVLYDQLASYGLTANDADPKFGITPLMTSVSGPMMGLPWLLSHGGDLDLKDVHGRTAYDYARMMSPDHSDAWLRAEAAKYR